MNRMNTTLLCASAVVCLSAIAVLNAQPPGGRFNFRAMAENALAEPFVGLTADGTVTEGLYSIERSGASTEAVRTAAEALLASLTGAQRDKASFPVDDSEWRNWANIHLYTRQGVGFDEMNDAQREAAHALLRASLSAKGYDTARDIMRLNHHLAELVENFDEYGEYLYWFTFMGEPSAEEPWGWQLDGHHLIVNYFVLGDQIVMTPTFMGSEPIAAESGTYEGTAIMEDEQRLAAELMASLTPEQRNLAILERDKGRGVNQAEMFRDNVVIPYEGLPVAAMDDGQRARLVELIGAYVGNIRDPHAEIRMTEVTRYLDETYFAWKGGTGPEDAFYYRIHSPVLYIEFDHQGPTALPGPRNVATRNHIHSVVRTPNGNDYGKDLLRQHYEMYANDPAHGHAAPRHPTD